MSDLHESETTPQRKRISVACQRCRKRKIRCNGSSDNQPCSNCKNAGYEPCAYLRVSAHETQLRNEQPDFDYNVDAARAFAARASIAGAQHQQQVSYAPTAAATETSHHDLMSSYRSPAASTYAASAYASSAAAASRYYGPTTLAAYGGYATPGAGSAAAASQDYEYPVAASMGHDVGMVPSQWPATGGRTSSKMTSGYGTAGYMDDTTGGYGGYNSTAAAAAAAAAAMTTSLPHRPHHGHHHQSHHYRSTQTPEPTADSTFRFNQVVDSLPGTDRVLPNPTARTMSTSSSSGSLGGSSSTYTSTATALSSSSSAGAGLKSSLTTSSSDYTDLASSASASYKRDPGSSPITTTSSHRGSSGGGGIWAAETVQGLADNGVQTGDTYGYAEAGYGSTSAARPADRVSGGDYEQSGYAPYPGVGVSSSSRYYPHTTSTSGHRSGSDGRRVGTRH